MDLLPDLQLIKGTAIMSPPNNVNKGTDDAMHQKTHTTMENLTKSIEGLSEKLETFMEFTQNSIPIKSVYLIFILVFALIFGIEGVQFLFKTWLPKLLG